MARPRKEHALDIPRRAVEETMRLLETRGDFNVPMTEVAAAVGCRAPALYGHFRNKNALLRAVHDQGFVRLCDEKLAVAARAKGDALERLRRGGRVYLGFALENPVLYRLMFTPPDVAEVTENPFGTDLGRRAFDILAQGVRACQEDGYLPDEDPAAYAFALWSAVHGAASLILQNREPAGGASGGRDAAFRLVDTVMALIEATHDARAAGGRGERRRNRKVDRAESEC